MQYKACQFLMCCLLFVTTDLGLELPADDPDYLAGNRLLGPNVWPDVPGFQETVSQY